MRTLFVLLITFTFAANAEYKTFEHYQTLYQEASNKYQKTFQTVCTHNNQKAYDEFKKLEVAFQKAGQLDELVMIKNFLKGQQATKLEVENAPPLPQVKLIFKKLQTDNNSALKSYTVRKRKLLESYLDVLQRNVKILTKLDLIEEAIKFQNEAKKQKAILLKEEKAIQTTKRVAAETKKAVNNELLGRWRQNDGWWLELKVD